MRVLTVLVQVGLWATVVWIALQEVLTAIEAENVRKRTLALLCRSGALWRIL